jgi:hypothetical protein
VQCSGRGAATLPVDRLAPTVVVAPRCRVRVRLLLVEALAAKSSRV